MALGKLFVINLIKSLEHTYYTQNLECIKNNHHWWRTTAMSKL